LHIATPSFFLNSLQYHPFFCRKEKIWSWVLRGLKPIMAVLAKSSSNLPEASHACIELLFHSILRNIL
jgi:hypothetical protein